MQLITDFHTHILPEIDDGSQSVTESINMLQSLTDQGVQRILLTPHFYPQRCSSVDFIQARTQAAQKLITHPDFPKNMAVCIAAEVYLHEALLNCSTDEIRQLCIPTTDFILTEFPYNEKLSASVLRRVSALIYNFNCIPVLAHIERYLDRLDDKTIEHLLEDGCRLQINLNHWETLPFLKKRRLMRLLRAGLVDCCGSDCHNLCSRPPEFAASAKRLESILDQDTYRSIITSKNIFK